MYRPTRLRDEFDSCAGVTRLWSEEELDILSAMGDAVAVGEYPYPGRVPQHHANSAADVMSLVDGYRRLADRLEWPCLFRGQTRDYYSDNGTLLVLPTLMRPPLRRIQAQLRRIKNPLEPWFSVLRELGIRTDSGIHHDFTTPDRRWHGKYSPKDPFTIIRSNHVVAGILQHYGFPTYHLDVSTDPVVSLWFALHVSSTQRRRISFSPVPLRRPVSRGTPPRPEDVADIPTLHVYIAPPFPGERLDEQYAVVDLSRLENLTAVARRPSRQSAVSLPFDAYLDQVYKASHGWIPARTTMIRKRWPAAIVKLHFPFEELERPDLTADALFPTDEILYRELLKAKAPHLAIYG